MNPSTILLTGFEPFGGESINPSEQIVRALDGELILGAEVHGQDQGQIHGRVHGRVLPCRFHTALDDLHAALADLQPVLVLALGQAGGRCDFSLERVAINLDDARIPDNGGAQPVDRPVVPGAPAAYFSRLPVKAMVAGLRAAGLPASLSHSAGTFVCNHVFYGLLHALAARPDVRAGFMHLPLLPEQAARLPGQPSLPLASQVHGAREALRLALGHRGADLTHSEGRLD